MTNNERKFRVVKPTKIQQTFGSTKLGWHYMVVSETDIKNYWHKNGEAEDKLVRTIEIGSIISLDEKIFLEWEGLRTDYFTQEITPAEEILEVILSFKGVSLGETFYKYLNLEKIEDAEGTLRLSDEEYDYLKTLEVKND